MSQLHNMCHVLQYLECIVCDLQCNHYNRGIAMVVILITYDPFLACLAVSQSNIWDFIHLVNSTVCIALQLPYTCNIYSNIVIPTGCTLVNELSLNSSPDMMMIRSSSPSPDSKYWLWRENVSQLSQSIYYIPIYVYLAIVVHNQQFQTIQLGKTIMVARGYTPIGKYYHGCLKV